MKYASFLIKFLLFSTLLYLLWIPFASAYFSAILKITAAYFELIGMEISVNPTPDFLYSQGIRSCIPPFIALILATNLSLNLFFEQLRCSIALQCERKALPTTFLWKRKLDQRKHHFSSLRESAILKGLIIGIPILFFFRVILQISYVYLQIRPTSEFYSIFVIFLSGTCRVALPFLLWFTLSYKQILPIKCEIREGFYICPFCGASKIGILDHIRDVHGEEALRSEEVEQLTELNPKIKK